MVKQEIIIIKYNKKLDKKPVFKISMDRGQSIFWSLIPPDVDAGERKVKEIKMNEKLFYSDELSDTDQEFILREAKLKVEKIKVKI